MSRYLICLIVCFTLGLAPYRPEPHLFEKLRWVADGAAGMRPIDWFDLLMHGTPWVVLLVMITWDGVRIFRESRQ